MTLQETWNTISRGCENTFNTYDYQLRIELCLKKNFIQVVLLVNPIAGAFYLMGEELVQTAVYLPPVHARRWNHVSVGIES